MTPPLALTPYSLLWRMARPVLRRHKRLREGFALRLVPDAWGDFPWGKKRTDLWIQAASGGESFLARQLLGELNVLCAVKPQQTLRILCTSCTRQGLDILDAARVNIKALWPNIDIAVRVFPLDEPDIMRRSVGFASPSAVVLLETELWPGLMVACAEKSIPITVVNGRMTEKSYLGYRLLGSLWRYAAPISVLAMAEADASRFAGLFGYDRVRVMPNMKFDGIVSSPPPPDRNTPVYRFLPQSLPVILLASVREEEEPLLAPVIASLRERQPDAVILVAPRHMERVAAWGALLGRKFGGDSVVLRSALELDGKAATAGNIVVWDRFGELTALYGRANAVFVGGSLAPLGGQNFLEPAGQGRVPIIGPYWKNFAWVGEEFFTLGLGVKVATPKNLASALINSLLNQPEPGVVRRRVASYIAPRCGGTRMAAQSVWAILSKARASDTYQ